MTLGKKLAVHSSIFAFGVAALVAGEAIAQRRNAKPIVGVHVVELPTKAAASKAKTAKNKEVTVLLETPRLKIASVVLRNRTTLPAHKSPMPITVQALSGGGTLRSGGKDYALSSGTLLALAPNQEHEVVPTGESDLILLVHHVKRRRGAKRP